MALWFPYLPTDRLWREKAQKAFAHSPPETARDALPLVTVKKIKNALRLSAVDQKASLLGLAIGQPLANARAMLPELEAVAADEPADLMLLTRIADWCDRFTPLVALDGWCSLLLDVTGVSHLFGGEREMLGRVCQGLQAQGFAVQGAVAGTAVAARAFARYREGSVIPSGEEEAIIAPLPIAALDLDAIATHAFRRAGLKTVGQAAGRKRSEIAARFGVATLAVIDAALGREDGPISPRQPPPDYWKEENFAEPLITEEAIRTALNSLTVALSKVLERHGEGTRRLEAVFFRTDGGVRRIAIEMGTPARDPAVIDRLFREKLAALADPLDPDFGFDLIRLSASRTERVYSETTALRAGANEEKEIGGLIDRLAARFGGDRILVFRTNGTHIPEAAWKAVPAQYAESQKLSWEKIRCAGDVPRRPLRLFARPEPVSILTAPAHLCWRRARRAIARREGPERIAMEWWRHETPQPARDYFRVEDNEGRRYWLCRGGEPPQWFLHGVFA